MSSAHDDFARKMLATVEAFRHLHVDESLERSAPLTPPPPPSLFVNAPAWLMYEFWGYFVRHMIRTRGISPVTSFVVVRSTTSVE